MHKVAEMKSAINELVTYYVSCFTLVVTDTKRSNMPQGFPGATIFFKFRGTTKISLLEFRELAKVELEEMDRQLRITVEEWEKENVCPFELDGINFLESEVRTPSIESSMCVLTDMCFRKPRDKSTSQI